MCAQSPQVRGGQLQNNSHDASLEILIRAAVAGQNGVDGLSPNFGTCARFAPERVGSHNVRQVKEAAVNSEDGTLDLGGTYLVESAHSICRSRH